MKAVVPAALRLGLEPAADMTRRLGWLLALGGFVAAACSAGQSPVFAISAVWGMALVNLALSRTPDAPSGVLGIAALGSILYVAGYLFGPAIWIASTGAIACSWCLFRLAVLRSGTSRAMFLVMGFGLALDALVAALSAAGIELPGGKDGMPQRMLRLSQAAATALPILALAFEPGAGRDALGRKLLAGGAIAMPLLLVAAAAVGALKYLLVAPVLAVFLGAAVGVRSSKNPLQAAGWLAVVLGTALGIAMSAFALGGPLEPPAALASYADPLRQLLRSTHVTLVVVGVAGIFASLERGGIRAAAFAAAGVALLLSAVVSALGGGNEVLVAGPLVASVPAALGVGAGKGST